MQLYDRLIAGVVWLQKFTVFTPMNLKDDTFLVDKSIVPWGNYAIGNNIYPNLFNIFIDYSPTASSLVGRKIDFIFSNVPKEIKNQRTTKELSFNNTVDVLLHVAGRDHILFDRSFAIWLGYNEAGLIDEFKAIPLENVRYVYRDEEKYPYTDSPYMIGIIEDADRRESIYYPYEPNRAVEQRQGGANGQILFYNTAYNTLYPDCIFNSMIPVLLSDPGIDTGIMSLLGNSDILKTYKKRGGTTGANAANGSDYFGCLIKNIWDTENNKIPEYGSDFLNTGVKAAGNTDYIDIPGDESINEYIKTPEFPKFMDEFLKIDERTARKICVKLQIPYEYFYKMDSGVINQENRDAMTKEINTLLDSTRSTFEDIINEKILAYSVFDWRIQIRPLGSGQEDVREANRNITGE